MRSPRVTGFTLIEMIVTLSVIAVLLAAAIIPFIRRLDRIAAEKEIIALKAMGTAFKDRVRKTRFVPDQTGWAAAVASELGWQPSEVTTTSRNLARVFLIDPAMQIGLNNSGGPLVPFTQTVTGSRVTNNLGTVIRPISPRFMIISTLGTPLPVALVSGVGDTSGPNAFASLWSTRTNAVPAGWSWSTGEDLKIQRIDLTDLFVAITLANSDSARVPSYGLDDLATANVTYTASAPPPIYFIRGTELKLYNADAPPKLEYSEVLFVSHDFTFELGTWEGKPYLGRAVGSPNGKDLQRAMDLFLKTPANKYAKYSITSQQIYDAMVSYMTNFINWRDDGHYFGEHCPGTVDNNNQYTQPLGDAQGSLADLTTRFIQVQKK